MNDRLLPCRHWAFLALAATLLVAAASAGTAVEGKFTATSAHSLGSSTLAAPLVAFLQSNRAGTDGKGEAAFTLAAQSLRVQTYSSDPTLRSVASSHAVAPQASNEVYSNADVQGLANRDSYQWSLFSLQPGDARIETVSTCSNVRPSSDSQVTRQSFVAYDAPDNTVTVPTADALLWADCSRDGPALKVTGKFLLMLWQWDAVIHADGQEHPLPSGQGPSSYDPTGSSESASAVSHDRQRYLYVEGGVLTIPRFDGGNYAIYVGPGAQAHSEAGFRFRDAKGSLTGGAQVPDLAAATLDVKGLLDLRLDGAGAGQPFSVQLAGNVEEVQADGKALALAAVAAAAPGVPWLLWAAVGAVVLPAAAVPALRRRRVPSAARRLRVEDRVDDLIGERDWAAAEPLTRKLLAWAPSDPWAHLRRATVLAQAGGVEGARQALLHHEEAHRLMAPHDPDPLLGFENALEAARAAARIHTATQDEAERQQSGEATFAWIAEGMRADRDALREMEAYEELVPFLPVHDAWDGKPYWLQP